MLRPLCPWRAVLPLSASLLLIALASPAAAYTFGDLGSFAQGCNVHSPPCAGQEDPVYASAELNSTHDSSASASASRNGTLRASASSFTENYVSGAAMNARAIQGTAFDVIAPGLDDGTIVDLDIDFSLDGSFIAGSYAYGEASVSLDITLIFDDASPSVTLFSGVAGAGGSGLNPFVMNGDFEGDDFFNSSGLYSVALERTVRFSSAVGESSFSIIYDLGVNTSGQGQSRFGNTGHFSVLSATPGVTVTAVPEPGTGLLFAGGLVALAGFRSKR